MDLVNNYGSSDEEDSIKDKPTSSSLVVNAAPETGFDVILLLPFFILFLTSL